MLIADVFIADIDEAMSQFEFRQEYAKQAGAALAKKCDQNVLQTLLLAARASTTVTGGNGGTQLTVATARTDADALLTAASDAAQALDEKDVPEGDRFMILKPDQYYLLVNSGSKAVHMDYNGGKSNGSVADGKVYKAFGFEIVKSNNLPSTNVASGPSTYQGDFTNTAALCFHRSAAGTVKLVDLAVEMDYLIDYQGTLVVAKMAVGHGILRPESAVEIKVA